MTKVVIIDAGTITNHMFSNKAIVEVIDLCDVLGELSPFFKVVALRSAIAKAKCEEDKVWIV